MADKVTEMLDRFTALAQQEKQLSADTDSIYKEYNDYLKSCDEDLNKKIEEIHAKMSKLDYYLNYAKEHAQASELEAASEPFETDEGHLESIRQTIKLDSRSDPNAESLYTKVTGMQLYYEQKIEETRRLIEGSKVQAKRQYDADIADLNRRKDEQDDKVRAYIRSNDFKDYLRLLTFDKSAFNSTGTAKIPENNTISLGQRRVRLTVPMDIEQDLAFISNNEYNAGARTIGAPFRISLKRGGVVCLDFDERNKQYLLGGIQRLLLNAVKYFGKNLEDVLFCEPESFSPDCLGHIAAFGRGAYPFIIIPNSNVDIEQRTKEYFADIERYPAVDAVSRIVVMHCFPEKYSDEVCERVLNLCKNAEKYGVLVVLTHYNAEDEGDVGAEIRELGISVRSKNGGFWVERLRESLFWYSAPSDIPMEIRRDFVENRRPKPKPEPIPEPVAAVEPEIPEELEIPVEPIPEIEEVVEEQISETVADIFGEMNEPEPVEESVPEPVQDVFEDMNQPGPVEESVPEPVADMFEDMNQPEPVEESVPEPVADMFEDMNQPEPVEESVPEPVADMFEEMNEPEPVEESVPEPVADMFEDMNQPEPVEESVPEPVADMFEDMNQPEPVEETVPEPVADMFGEMNEPEPVEESVLEPVADMFEDMNQPESVEETVPEPVADMFEDMNQPEPVEESVPEPVADMFEEMSEPEPVEESAPEPVADMFEDMNQPEPVEESVPEPVADMFGDMNQPESVEESAPEPVQDMFEEMNEPEPVEESVLEPVADMFGEMNEPEPVEESAPEPVADMFEEMNEPEPVEESVPEPVQENIPAHILFANQPKPEEKDVTITPVVEIHETLPPAADKPKEPSEIKQPIEQPVTESVPAQVTEVPVQSEREIPEKPVNADFTAKCTRRLPKIALGLDVNEDPVTFDISGNITYICGKPCAERHRLIDAIIKTLICELHPDDLELWMFDCGGEELLRFAENATPHIRYLVDDASAETTFDLIDTLDSEMSRRAEMLMENHWKTFADIPANIYLPQMMVVVNDFPKMLANMETAPKFFGRSCIDKAKDMFKRCDEFGIHFLLIGETFAVNDKRPACFEGYKIHSGAAVTGCDDGVQTLFSSLRLYENEIASLKRIPNNCAFVADINSTDGLTLVRFTGKLPENDKRYRAVGEYTENPAEYVEKHAIVGDKRDAVTFEERRPVREKLLAKRTEGEIMMFLGEPCRFMSQYPVRLCEDFGENVLAVMPRREHQTGLAVIISALRSLEEQGASVEIISSRSNPIYTELCSLGIPDGVKVYESELGVERICEIAAQIANGNVSKSVEIILGGDLIFAAMHAEDKIGDLKSALVKGARYGVHFMFTTTNVSQMSTGFLSMFRHKIVLSCPQNDAEKVLRDPNSPLPENAFRLSDDYDELTIIPYSI